MNIKRVNLELSAEDLLSIFKDFVHVKGLYIENIQIDDLIHIQGIYKKLFKLPFKISAGITGIKDNRIFMTIASVSVGKIGVFNWMNKLALKILAKTLRDKGIEYINGNVSVFINRILELIPFSVNLYLKNLSLVDKHLEIEVEKISFKVKKEEVITNNDIAIVMEEVKVNNETDVKRSKEKVEDAYAKVRVKVENNVPDKYSELIDYLMIMPDIAALFYRLFKDRRVPLRIKIIVGGIITYLALPMDIVPDFIPFVGKIDDLALTFYALNKIINEVPENIIKENWQGREDIIVKVKEAVEFLNKAAGGTNVGKLLRFLRRLSLE